VKHTPGPWERVVYDHGGSRIFKGRTLIADTFQAGDRDLLFAAPDLLEAAQGALNALRDYVETLENQGASLHYGRRVIGLLDAAIEKAEGA